MALRGISLGMRCPSCERYLANVEDSLRYKQGEGDHLCWRAWMGDVCHGRGRPSAVASSKHQWSHEDLVTLMPFLHASWRALFGPPRHRPQYHEDAVIAYHRLPEELRTQIFRGAEENGDE